MDKPKWLVGITIYLLLAVIVATSLEMTFTSDIGNSIAVSGAGVTLSFLGSCMLMFWNILTFQLAGVPAIWYFLFFNVPIMIVLWLILDLIIRIIRGA